MIADTPFGQVARRGTYIEFVAQARNSKTAVFGVRTAHSGLIGTVKWCRWRRYAFFPEAETMFDALCLREIVRFLDDLMGERRPFIVPRTR